MKKFTFLVALISMACFAVNAQHWPVTPIDSVQYVTPATLAGGADKPSYFNYGDTVTVEGVVTFHPGFYGLSTNRKGSFLQLTGKDEWAGIAVLIDPGRLQQLTGVSSNLATLNQDIKFYENFIPGLTVKVSGIIDNFQGNTQLILLPIESEITNLTPNPIQPTVVAVSDFMQNDGTGNQEEQYLTGEPYEGMYVEVRNVTVVDVVDNGNGRFFWSLQDANGNKIQVRDMSRWFRNDNNADSVPANYTFQPPAQGTQLSFVRGIIEQNNFGYQLAPLDTNDIGTVAFSPPAVREVKRTPVVPAASQTVTVAARIDDADDAVASATLYYRAGASGTTNSVAMTMDSTDWYSGTIPAQANGSFVTYWISATDVANNTTYHPDSMMTGMVYRVLNNGITEIRHIQATPTGGGASIYANQTLQNMDIHAVVVATVSDLGKTVIQDGVSPYSGVFVMARVGTGVADLKIGDSIHVTGASVIEDFGVTHLDYITFTKISSNATVPAPVANLPMDSIIAGVNAYAEAYEGMLLEFTNVLVVSNNPDSPSYFGEWAVAHDSNATGLRVDDFSTKIDFDFGRDTLELYQSLDYIRGVLYFSFGNWKLLPRDKNDIAGYQTQYVGIAKKSSQKLGLYPNPAQDVIWLTFEAAARERVNLRVFDVTGKVVLQTILAADAAENTYMIPVGSLKPGIYIVKTESAGFTGIGKFIRQ